MSVRSTLGLAVAEGAPGGLTAALTKTPDRDFIVADLDEADARLERCSLTRAGLPGTEESTEAEGLERALRVDEGPARGSAIWMLDVACIFQDLCAAGLRGKAQELMLCPEPQTVMYHCPPLLQARYG